MGRGRYYRNELLAAIAWCEKFPECVELFEFEGAMEFIPAVNEQPFGFVRELFDQRSRIVAETEERVKAWKAGGEIGPKPYNILEKAIKIILNSLYDKTAQSLGSKGELPNSSNPFYAGAISAGTRAGILLAALHNPQGVIFMATDGIMTLGPLEGLETVREKVLGKWEFAQELDKREAAVFVHPGIYSFYDHKGKPHTKTRGFKIEFARDFMMKEIVRARKTGDKHFLVGRNGRRELIPKGFLNEVRCSKKKSETIVGENKLSMETNIFITLRMAVSSEENWKKCGSWSKQNRDMNLQSAGEKRMLCNDKRRAEQLVFAPPAENSEDGQLSAPYYPDWLDQDGLEECESEQEIENKFGAAEED